MNATEIVPPPMRRAYDEQRIYSNVYGNDSYSYMYDPNVYYVGFGPQGFGDATAATTSLFGLSTTTLLGGGAILAIGIGVWMAKRAAKKSGLGRRRHRRR
jgi:hypothetical protein